MEKNHQENTVSFAIKKEKSINNNKNNKQFYNNKNYLLRKKPTSKPHQRKNDIYITNKSNFKVINISYIGKNIMQLIYFFFHQSFFLSN